MLFHLKYQIDEYAIPLDTKLQLMSDIEWNQGVGYILARPYTFAKMTSQHHIWKDYAQIR